MAQVEEEVAVEEVLALLVQPQRAVDLGARLARHHRAQEVHVGRRDLHLDEEVRAREAEDDQQLVFAEEGRVDGEPAARRVQDRQRERRLVEAVDDLADDVSALVAEEQGAEHLDLEVGAQAHVTELLAHSAQHVVDVAAEVLEVALQLVVGDDAQQRVAQRLARRVVGAVGGPRGRLVVFDVLGAHRRPHEDEVVAEVAAVQDLRRHRVEEGLGELRLVMLDQHADVVQLDLVPHLHRQLAGAELGLQPLGALVDALVVELDALALRALLAVPVSRLEAALRLGTGLAEQAVVLVEAFEHRPGDVEGAAVGELLRKHACPEVSKDQIS